MLTAYLAKKLAFATPGPVTAGPVIAIGIGASVLFALACDVAGLVVFQAWI